MKTYQRDTCENIADNYGVYNQVLIAMEEMSELTKELCKYRRFQKNIPQIAEEIADVKIMLQQLEYLFGVENLVDAQIDEKLNRQLERMKEERR